MKYLLIAFLLFVPSFSHAALSAMTGFETGDLNETGSTAGTISINSSVARTGTYSFRVNPATTGTGDARINEIIPGTYVPNSVFATQRTQNWVTFYFRYATKPASANEYIFSVFDNNNDQTCGLVLSSTGKLVVLDTSATPAPVATSTNTLSADTWYRIEFTCVDNAAGAYDVLVDGTSVASGTANFDNNGWRSARFGKTLNRNGNSVDFYYDDIWVDTTGFRGSHAIRILSPHATGTDNAAFNNQSAVACSGTTCYDRINRIPLEATEHVVSTAANQDITFRINNTAPQGITGTINAVHVVQRVTENSVGTSIFQMKTYSNGGASTTAGNDASGGAIRIWNLPTEPFAGASWTLSMIDGMEIGCRDGTGSGVRIRCNDMHAMVSYTGDDPTFGTPSVKVVHGTLSDTLGGTTDFTSSGMGNPTAAIILAGQGNTTNNPNVSTNQAIGFWTPNDVRVANATDVDNSATMVTARSSNDSYGLVVSGDATHAAAYTISTTTDGIRLTLAVDNTTVARYATAILFYNVPAKVITFVPNATSGNTATSTNLAFDPDLVFFTSIGDTVTDRVGIGESSLSFGYAETSLAQGATFMYQQDNVADEVAIIYQSTNRAGGQAVASLTWAAEVVKFGQESFAVTTRTGATGGDYMFALALGGDLSFDTGFFTTPTATGATTTPTGVEPGALLTSLTTAQTVNVIQSTSTANGWVMGAADETTEQSYNMSVEDAAATSNANGYSSTTAIIDLDTSSGGTVADLINATVALNASDFELTYSKVDAQPRKGWWVTFAADAAAPGGATVIQQSEFWF